MKYEKGTRNDDVVDVRGRKSSAAPKIAGGSIVVVLLLFVASRFLGVDVSNIGGGGGGGGGGDDPSAGGQLSSAEHEAQKGSAAPLDGPDPDAELVDFISFAMKDIQDTFEQLYQESNTPYHRAKLYIFNEAINTACGRSTKAIGPFYCPGDWNAYIDLSFYKELRARFGAPGDFAQAYVLAHEIGHHLQNLAREQGREPKCPRGESRNQCSVHVELQADCFAGVWGHHAQNKKLLDAGDLEEAITAATAIGDDRLQKQAGADDVNPESFTHGTSEQRVAWFRRGFDSGRLDACNTYAAAMPR
ncbi:MAG TPA: neutral zinc metallopeptidase [Kofleriaceae bacterium]|nr:neutral zinc metallopeptidase [Kofleriaceae bacterium]